MLCKKNLMIITNRISAPIKELHGVNCAPYNKRTESKQFEDRDTMVGASICAAEFALMQRAPFITWKLTNILIN